MSDVNVWVPVFLGVTFGGFFIAWGLFNYFTEGKKRHASNYGQGSRKIFGIFYFSFGLITLLSGLYALVK